MMEDLLQDQATRRSKYLNAILESPSPRKLVVAGPGTGKTFTFGELFRRSAPAANLALTFIRKLVNDMDREFGNLAEVKTFHAYCKKLLHERHGAVELVPYLTTVVEEDADAIGRPLANFDNAFQTLAEDAPEVAFYLDRGDYYKAVSFNDSVFRVYREVKDGTLALPMYVQVVIDEYQDFNPLEVALIDELEKHAPILLVGDDDQAVYSLRGSSPDYLRQKVHSGQYEVFELPFCSRCPRVVVEGTSAFVASVVQAGGFRDRIARPFVPYLSDKDYENAAYPKIVAATTSNIACLARLVRMGIERIPERDVREAHEGGYPCVLIVGLRQYLNPIHKSLVKHYPQAHFTQGGPGGYSILDGYKLLLRDEESNLGWRVIAGCELPLKALKPIIRAAIQGMRLKALLPDDFVRKHSSVLGILGSRDRPESAEYHIYELLGDEGLPLVDYFFPEEQPDQPQEDETKPSILLSSFEGCKGLSAGHVFVVGLNDGIVPKLGPDGGVSDIECSKFLVAMTRTRKLLYLVSNRRDYAPKGASFERSVFMSMLPPEALSDGGYLRAADLQAFLANT